VSVPEDAKIAIEMKAENWAFGDLQGSPRDPQYAVPAPAAAAERSPSPEK